MIIQMMNAVGAGSSNVAENDTERLRCVKEVLRINPNNSRAKQLLEILRGIDSHPLQRRENRPGKWQIFAVDQQFGLQWEEIFF